MGREVSRSWHPAVRDRAAELSVPHPPPVPWYSRYSRSVRERYARTFGVGIDLLGDEENGIRFNAGELVLSGLRPDVIGRPSSAQRGGVTVEMFDARPNQFHWPYGSSPLGP